MPDDSAGVFSLVNGYLAVTGQDIEASQHNPPLEDIATALTARVCKDGRNAMTGNLKMGTKKIVNVGDPTSDQDVATKIYVDKLTNTARVDVASAATTNIGGASAPTVKITGTETITAFDEVDAGLKRDVLFEGALTLTHNATSLILPTGANITTAAGDTAKFISEGSGNWRCYFYQRANGEALVVSEDTYNTFAEGDAKDTPASGKVVGYAKNDGRFYFKDDTGAEIAAYPIGTDQTWQDVSANRSLNTVYQNTTGRPIQVSAYVQASSGSAAFTVSADGETYVTVAGAPSINSGGRGFYSVIVPAGHYYNATFTGGATISYWSELR